MRYNLFLIELLLTVTIVFYLFLCFEITFWFGDLKIEKEATLE